MAEPEQVIGSMIEYLFNDILELLEQLDTELHELDDEAFSKWKHEHKPHGFTWHEVDGTAKTADLMGLRDIVVWFMCNNTFGYKPMHDAIQKIGWKEWGH